jgi:GNAT superfamily N-acetyltransferase
MDEVAEALQMPASERSAIWQRGAYVFLCATGGEDDFWALENVATHPAYRRRGLTNALLNRAVEQGRGLGLKEAQIAFLIGNEAAERAYLSAGFRLAGERRDPDFEAIAAAPGLRRVVRPL